MSITIENATVTATGQNGVRYVHEFVTNININDPRTNALTVSPQSGGNGIAYRTGTTSPVSSSLTVRGLPVEMVDFYKRAFDTQERFDLMVVDTRTGERYDLNNSIVANNPRNSNISEGEGALDQALNFSTPPADFSHVGASV